MKRQAAKVWRQLVRVESDADRWIKGDNSIVPGEVFGRYLLVAAGAIALSGKPVPFGLAALFGEAPAGSVVPSVPGPRDYRAEREEWGERITRVRLFAGAEARSLERTHGLGRKEGPYRGEESDDEPELAPAA
jgi:hypothetical protein